ncbi:MAG: GH32 C-terminal domain-containing protein [Muribaculaceae bacterium]|nr:GH32 C-terminal domain-containing protein [Muribaculaceae bacterium]
MMKTCKWLMAVGAIALSIPTMAHGNDGLEITYLSPDNTMVRITGEESTLLLPTQDNVEDATINVIVDNQLVKTIRCRLAQQKVDLTVPMDLTPYKGKKVVLSVVTPQGRSGIREARTDVCWRDMKLTNDFVWKNTEAKYRPAYHHAPQWGWMNDPNGMFYKDGKWHLAYQWNPYGAKWQNLSWGHSVSSDLVNWEHMPVAIEPDGLGMIFSGSAAIDTANTVGYGPGAVVALYTSADRNQIQSLAGSNDDGLTYQKYDGNPVLANDSEARDPNMFWNEKTGKWTILLAHALEHEMLIFSSPDLKEWTLESSFGKGLGEQGGVWECPDLFEVPVAGTNKTKWVLLCNINPGGPFGGSATQYFVGDFDGKTFKADTNAKGEVETKWMDYGKDHYATVSFSGTEADRRVVIGWMSNWEYANEVPTLQYRSANTLPREVGLFKGADGQLYVSSAPAREMLKLRGENVVSADKFSVSSTAAEYQIPESTEGLMEIVATIDAAKNSKVNFTLANSKGEKVDMTYDAATRTMNMDRTQAGLSDFSDRFPAVTVAPTRENKGKVEVRIFVDRTSVELFGNNGQFVMTNLVFPTEPYTQLSVSGTGKATVSGLKVYAIQTNK